MPTPQETSTQEPKSLSKEETAWLMKTLWRALQAPAWTFETKKALEKLGEALFSGKELKDLDDKTLDRIFPHLVTVTQSLGTALNVGMPERETPTARQKESNPSLHIAPPTPPSEPAIDNEGEGLAVSVLTNNPENGH